jgi:hypothetical protein
MPVYVLRCKSCRDEVTWYAPSFARMESQLNAYECAKCKCREYEKVPQPTSWMWGDNLKEKN